MKDTLKRLTCMLLALIMVAGMFPVSVFADAENTISDDAGRTVSNVISPLQPDGEPEVPEEPAEEPVVEPVEEIPEVPVFDTTKPIKYQAEHSTPFSVLKVLTEAGAPVNTIIGVTGDMEGRVFASASGSDWLLTPYAYFEKIKLSVTARDYPDGEEAVYTIILSDPDPVPVAKPAVTLTATVDNTTIIVDAPEGAFPEGIQLRAAKADPAGLLVALLKDIGYPNEMAAELAQKIIESGADLSAYIQNFTLTFYLPAEPNRSIEPSVDVEVKFENLSISTEDVVGFHDDGTSVDKLNTEANGDIVTVSVPSFSETGFGDRKGVVTLLNGVRGESTIDWVNEYGAPCNPTDENPDGTSRFLEFLKWLGDAYYKPGGRFYNPNKILLSVTGPTGATPVDEDTYLAGQTLRYDVTYFFDAADSFADNPYPASLKLFNDYENIVLKIKLPEGLYLGQSAFQTLSSTTVTEGGKNYTVYTLGFPSTVSANSTEEDGFWFEVFIGNNGTALSINDYDFPDDMISLYAEWTVRDKRTGDPGVPLAGGEYELTATTTVNDIHTITPDKWGVEKTSFGTPTVDKANKTVTFKWQVNVGMLGTDGETLLTKNTDYDT